MEDDPGVISADVLFRLLQQLEACDITTSAQLHVSHHRLRAVLTVLVELQTNPRKAHLLCFYSMPDKAAAMHKVGTRP